MRPVMDIAEIQKRARIRDRLSEEFVAEHQAMNHKVFMRGDFSAVFCTCKQFASWDRESEQVIEEVVEALMT